VSQNWNPPPGPGGPPPGGYGPPPGGYGAPPPPPGGFGAPPPGGYGVPPGYGPQPGFMPVQPVAVEGNFGLGFCAGFFGGCLGWILVAAFAKGAQTKKGAGIGFAAQIVAGAVFRAIGAAVR